MVACTAASLILGRGTDDGNIEGGVSCIEGDRACGGGVGCIVAVN